MPQETQQKTFKFVMSPKGEINLKSLHNGLTANFTF